MYKYKLKEQENDSKKGFQQERLRAFDEISDKMARLKVLVDDARTETEKYYKENPDSYSVVYSTDLAVDYLEDMIKMFNQTEDTE
jgi:hypothetical protein